MDHLHPILATPLSQFAKAVKDNNWPSKLDVGLIGFLYKLKL